jgi:hypothetical protein
METATMDEQTRTERAEIVWDSDATCPCGADPKANDGAAITDDRWHMDMFPQADGTVLAEVRCPTCW